MHLLEKRLALYNANEKDPQVDVLADKIMDEIEFQFESLPVDFIIETYTKLGYAPNIIYDDNGLFAVTSAGYQEVVIGDEKLEGPFTVFVEKEQWKKTIREAVRHYIFSE